MADPSIRSRSSSVSRRLAPGAVAVSATVLTLIVFTRLAAPTAIWSPNLTDHPGYSPVDPPMVQEVWPALGTAAGLGARIDAAATAPLAGAGAVLLVFVLVRRLGGGLLASTSSALGLAFGGLFWSRATGAEPVTYAALFALATLGGLLWWRQSGKWLAGLAAAAAFGLTVAFQPVTLAALPIVAGVVGADRRRPRAHRAGLAALVILAAAAGTASVWGAFGGEAILADWLLPHGASGLARRLTDAGTIVVSDFGVLGLGFLVAGAFALALERPRATLVLVGGWAASVALGGLVWAAPDWKSSVLPALSPAWVLVGMGMHWLVTPAPGRRPWRAATALALLLPVMSFAGHYWVGARASSARTFMSAHLDTLETVLPKPAVVLAEGGMVDRLIAARSHPGSDGGWRRVAQDPERVGELLRSGQPVVGFVRARTNLEQLGFRFAPVEGAGVLMSVEQLIETVPDGWIVAVAAGRGFSQLLLPDAGATFQSLGGSAVVFGARRMRYGLIGVKGRGSVAREALRPAAVDLEVLAGDSTGTALRWPARIRVISNGQGGAVEYGGRRVASAETGVALAVVSPTGELAGAYGVELDGPLRIAVVPASLRLARVVAREPCVSVGAEDWTDLSPVGRFGAVGAILDRGTALALYVAAGHELAIRQAPLGHAHVPGVTVRLVDRQDSELPASLTEASFVYRVDARARRGGRAQVALRFGGFATATLARVSPAGADRVEACSAMRGGAGLFARRRARAQAEELDLDAPALFPYGWDRAEGAGRRRIRWTRVPDAEMLLPLADAGRFVLEIEAQPVGQTPATMTVEINDRPLDPVDVQPGSRAYRWTIPAGLLREGLNRVRVSTPALIRPSEALGNTDDRLLGLGVTRVRLIRAESLAEGEPADRGPM
jgi:hypothetical protein